MSTEPRATYRLQLRPGFGFEHATALLPYLVKLGISHVYTSPLLQAAEGSQHGYDVVDPTRVNRELGGEEGLERFFHALKAANLSLLVDIVPNHMATGGRQNPWWWSVLEDGPSSPFATFFDVDWEASEERWPNKVLLPVLSDHYGRILDQGGIQLRRDEAEFILEAQGQAFPVDLSSLAPLLDKAALGGSSELLSFLAKACAHLPGPASQEPQALLERHRDKAQIRWILRRLCREDPTVAAALDAEVARVNASPDRLDRLIENQNYRLAFYRTASRDLGYRRFFDIKELAGLRIEQDAVFDQVHALPIKWAQQGHVQGLRVDHPDGLHDPSAYFQRLKQALPGLWIVAEKILAPGEALPTAWPVAGSTGYDFLALSNGLMNDIRGEPGLAALAVEFACDTYDFSFLAKCCKLEALDRLLGSELNSLADLFTRICEKHRDHRDYSKGELRDALREVAACLPVYRTYIRAEACELNSGDMALLERALSAAAAARSDLDPGLFRFLGDILFLRIRGREESTLLMRLQQLFSATAAKGVEDTAFYRYLRLLSLNEVGSDPGRFITTAENFHRACARAQQVAPRSLLAGSTHDTKRSEDVRCRLAVLTEMTQDWSSAVRRWSIHNARHRQQGLPDRPMEYYFYQSLVGAWPVTRDRMEICLEKAAREAKVHTNWQQPNLNYESALRGFVTGVMQDQTFMDEAETLANRVTGPGRLNSLAQLLLRLSAPGVPDVYQGSDLWDLNLTDPDNRRPVDFGLRSALLDELDHADPALILARMDEGLPKLWVLRQSLALRYRRPATFGPKGSYRPLRSTGGKADHVIAFTRGESVVSIVPRLTLGLASGWQETELELPPGRFRNLLTGEKLRGVAGRVDQLLARFPVALLERED